MIPSGFAMSAGGRAWIFCFLLALLPAAAEAGRVPASDFFVSTSGRDSWSGKLAAPNRDGSDGPFATLERARQAVRALDRSGRRKPVRVLVRGGVYELEAPLVFRPEDSGSFASPVVYAAWPGERPVISGGRRISGFEEMGGRWEVRLPEAAGGNWKFRQLFVDGERRFRPRLPAEGYFHVARGLSPSPRFSGRGHDRFAYAAGDIPEDLSRFDEVEILLFHNWFMSRMHIADLDAGGNIVTLSGPTVDISSWADLSRGRRFILENVRSALCRPGQWYLDYENGNLEYLPRRGERIGRTEVMAPRLTGLVRLEGNPEKREWVRHIQFRGIAFMHTAFSLADEGYSWYQAESVLGAAVTGLGARDCALVDCELAHLGQYAVEWGQGCRDNILERCTMHDLGAGGVKIGTTRLQQDPELETIGQTVRDSTIAHIARVHPAAAGIWIGHSARNVIEHNDIYDLYSVAVSVGWSWGYGESGAHHNSILNNHIYNLGQAVLTDMGGIYTLGVSPGTVLSGNVIHDVESYDYGGWGIYFDEGSTGVVAENNLVYRTKSGGFHQHYGRDNKVRNNIFALSREGQLIRTREEDHLSFTLERNIILSDGAPLLGGNWMRGGFVFKENIYWDLRGIPRGPNSELSWEEWERSGRSGGFVIADPKFKAPRKGDFRLRKGSAAAQIGFKPFDYRKSGRLTRPARFRPAPAAYDAGGKDLAASSPFREGFEEIAEGAKVPDAATYEDNEKATARVSAEAACEGRHSLKFLKAEEFKELYNPHVYFSVDFEQGIVVASFCLRMEGAAAFTHEWREVLPGAGFRYRAGPSLTVEPDGIIKANNRELGRLPLGKWVKFELACGLGDQAKGTYDLTLAGPDRERREFPGLTYAGPFERLDWLGFSAYGNQAGVAFYLDDVSLAPR